MLNKATKDLAPPAADTVSAGTSSAPTADGTPEQVLKDATEGEKNRAVEISDDGDQDDGDESDVIVEGFEEDDIGEWRSDTIPIRCV